MTIFLAQVSAISCLVSQELPNWPDFTTPPIPTCLSVRSRPWDKMRIHKQVIYQEVLLGETAKEVQEARQGGEESKQRWAFTHSPAFAWSRRELWSVHCTSEFVPSGGKGAGLSYLYTVNHWLRAAPRDVNSPALSALCWFCQSSSCSPKMVLWINSQLWAVRSEAYRSWEEGHREIAKGF